MIAPADQPLLVDRPVEGVLRLALNRPGRRNAVDDVLLSRLHDALDRHSARSIVLCSATPGMFCSGADLRLDNAARAAVSNGLYDLYRRMICLDVPLIVALDGPAVGGGANLAAACDVRIAGPGAWFRFLGPGHGLVVGAWALPSMVGRGRALDLCLSGKSLDAAAALQIGLVDRVATDPGADALALAETFVGLDATAVARTKALVTRTTCLVTALDEEARGNRGWTGRA